MLNHKSSIKILIGMQCLVGIILLNFISVPANNRGDWFDKLSKIGLGSTSRAGLGTLFDIQKSSQEKVSFEQIQVSYGTDYGLLNVTYASGKGCSKITNMGWRLKKDLVVNYFFVANEETKFSRLGIKLEDLTFNKWDEEKDRYYTNPKTGTFYKIVNDSLITQAGRIFTSEQLKKYSCEHFIKIY